MLKNKIVLFALIIIFAVSFLQVRYAGAEVPLSLKGMLDEALKSNPEIMASKRNYEAASARIWQAASLKDPLLELEYNNIYADRSLSGDPMKMYAVTQEIPFPTKLYLRAKMAAKAARIAYESYKAKERSIIAQVKSSYSELLLAYRSIDIRKEEKGLLTQLSSSASNRYSAGQGAQADALKAQVELAKVDNQLIMLEQKRVTAQAKLNVLINRDPAEEIGVPAQEEPVAFDKPLEDFYTAAQNGNPELKAYRYAIERGKTAYDLSLNEFMPDFMFRFEQMVKRDRIDSKTWAGSLGVTIPLWFFQKQAFGVKEMRSELDMVKSEYRAKENSILFDIRDAYARADANKKVVELYETAFIPQADETLKAAIKGYESGRADFLTLLDSQRMLIDFKLDHYNSILEFRTALADLERSTGVDIDKLNQKGQDVKK